jgi:hypothetical protein
VAVNGHAKVSLTTFAEAVSKGRGRPTRMTPTARIGCICGWTVRRHAGTYQTAQRLAEIAFRFHLEEFDALPGEGLFA